MSTIVEILQSTEEVLLPDGSRMLAQVAEREEALMQASLRESTLWREREHQRLQMQRVALAGNRSNSGGYSDARSGGRRPGANPPLDPCSREGLDYSPQHWQAGSSRLPSSRVMLPAYAGPCLGSRPVAWLDGMVEILVSDNREG